MPRTICSFPTTYGATWARLVFLIRSRRNAASHTYEFGSFPQDRRCTVLNIPLFLPPLQGGGLLERHFQTPPAAQPPAKPLLGFPTFLLVLSCPSPMSECMKLFWHGSRCRLLTFAPKTEASVLKAVRPLPWKGSKRRFAAGFGISKRCCYTFLVNLFCHPGHLLTSTVSLLLIDIRI